jgi:zinc protease
VTTTLARGLSPVRAVLDNGAVVLVQENSLTPAVTIHATLLAGSMYDPPGLPGLAYLTGRVIDRGTERRSAETIAAELDERGVSLKATTSRHATTLSCTCLAEDFTEMLALVVDVLRRPEFPEEELARRRAEAITRLRQDEDNPAVRATVALCALLYGEDHPYGRPAKGTVETIERMARADIVCFHARHVRPSVLTLAVVGDVGSDEVLDRASAELDGWTGEPAGSIVVPAPSVTPGRRRVSVAMPGKSQADISYGFTTISRLDPRYHAYWIMNNILGQFGLGGRLADNIRERQGMAYYAFSAFDPSVGEGPLIVRAGVDPSNVERAIAAIDDEVRQLGVAGPTGAEMDESRQYLIGSIPRMFETNPSIAAFLQRGEQFGLGIDYDRRLPALLEAVTIDDVRAAAAEVLVPDCAAIAVAGPADVEAEA